MIGKPQGELAQAFWSEDQQEDALAGRDEIQHSVSDHEGPDKIPSPFRPHRVLLLPMSSSGALRPGVLPFRAGIRRIVNYGLVQHLATIVEGALDYTPGLAHDPLHRLPGLVDPLLEQAPGLLRHLSYGPVRRLADLPHRLFRRVAHPSGQLAHRAPLAYRLSGCAADLS